MKISPLLWALALACCTATWAQAPTPAGLWTTFSEITGKPEGLVLIEERDGEFIGSIVKIFSATAPNPVCDQCEGELRNRPVLGMTILRGLRRFGGRRLCGNGEHEHNCNPCYRRRTVTIPSTPPWQKR